MPREVSDERLLTDGEIDAIVARYGEAVARYEDSATLVETRLRRELHAAAIRSLISSRAKHPEEVRSKLARLTAKRDPRATYARASDKLNHVVTDLAGVRVIVYHPDEEEAVFQLVQRRFCIASLPNSREQKRDKYRASHVLVELDDTVERSSLRGTVVEIQISSLASHVFNELEHDIQYKSHGVAPTASVKACLDDLNHASRLLDRVVQRLLNERSASRAEAQTTLEAPEDLRYSLEKQATRPLSGDFVRLFRLLNAVLAELTPATLFQLGPVDEILAKGRPMSPEGDEAGFQDDVTAYVLGLMDQFGPEFRELASTWRGPTTELKRAILGHQDAG